MRLATKTAGRDPKGGFHTYHLLRFEPDAVRYLAGNLNGEVPKLTWQGTIGQGLTVWFEARGAGMRPLPGGDGLEATIPAEQIAGYRGNRPPLSPKYERVLHLGKPAIRIEPVMAYDRDADEVSDEVFNTALAIPKDVTPPALVVAQVAVPPPPRPEQPKMDIAAVVARHTNGKAATSPSPNLASVPKVNAPPRMVPAMPRFGALPKRLADERQRIDVKTLQDMMNEALRDADDLIVCVGEDQRSIRVQRVRYNVEELV